MNNNQNDTLFSDDEQEVEQKQTQTVFVWTDSMQTGADAYKKTASSDIVKHINKKRVCGFEVLSGCVVPYYDFDPIYNTEEEQEDNLVSDYKRYLSAVVVVVVACLLFFFFCKIFTGNRQTSCHM